MKEYYSRDERITIERTDDGKYWITYGVGYSPCNGGCFKIEGEAIKTLKKLRPEARLYREG